MRGGRRTLADDLAELINPLPQDVDPEAQDAVLGAASLQHHDDHQLETLTRDMHTGPGTRKGQASKLPLRAGIQLEEEEYRGRRTTRQQMFEQDDEDGLGDVGSGRDLSGDGSHDDDLLANGDVTDEGVAHDDGEGEERTILQHTRKRVRGHLGNGYDNGAAGSNSGRDDDDDSDTGSDGAAESFDDEDADADDGSEAEDEEAAASDSDDDPGDKDVGAVRRSDRGGGGELDSELAQLEAGFQAQQAAEARAVAALQEKGQRDVVKGRAARHQQALYERVLEMRILLQKAVVGANRLPLPDATVALLAHSPPQPTSASAASGHQGMRSDADIAEEEEKEGLEGSRTVSGLQQKLTSYSNAACETLSQLMELHDTLIASPHALAAQGSGVCGATTGTAPPPPPAAPDTSDAYWAALSSRYEALAPFRDAAIDRWHARAVLGSGSAALNGRLRALHQSVSKQVANVMQDPAKLIARSRLATGAGHRHLGAPAVDGDAADGTDEGYGAAVVRDEETFDDGDFYQQLLQEFLDRGGSGGGQLLARPPKKRKLVDRRASKGRKIRYNVQDKLVNFMASVPLEPPVFAAQLFANLFGHRNTA